MGAFIGVARLLVSSEDITLRLVTGRAILGSAVSLVAGCVLIKIPSIDPMALLGVGSLLGIVGQQYIEKFLRARIAKAMGLEKKK